jgi:large subunit ribosomal protein L35Ae
MKLNILLQTIKLMNNNKMNKKNYEKGIIMGFKRSLKHQNVSKVRIKINKVKNQDISKNYLGKKIFYILDIQSKKKIIWGKIISYHGRSGGFIAKFKKNLPPICFSSNIYITMFPSIFNINKI